MTHANQLPIIEGHFDHQLCVGTKGMPMTIAGLPLNSVGQQGWNLLDGDVTLPAAILIDSALRHNASVMAAFAEHHGIRLAPHGKTTMSPQLFQRQFEAGAWALTAATPAHLAIYRAIGIPRIIYANQLVDPGAIAFLCEALTTDPALEVICLVDSFASSLLLAEGAAEHKLRRRIDVLIELGMSGGRTGLRTAEAAVVLARKIAGDLPSLRLRGVEAFEGIVPFDAFGRGQVDRLLKELETAANGIAPLVAPLRPILSVGGSAYFPMIVDRFRDLVADFEIVLRSGCYLTHDHGMYEAGQTSPFCHGTLDQTPVLRPALEVWGHIQSRPEPGRAYATIGKRDISHDAGLPSAIKWSPRTKRDVFGLTPDDARVVQLNDQHAYLEIRDDHSIAVGDRIAFGCSHPCTTFDKWRFLHVVDDNYGIIEGVATCF
jgi:D-serine dehydratase